jgi:catechol-2,3-dioxygenase
MSVTTRTETNGTATRGFKIDSLNHIVLWVSDLKASKRFYHEILGLGIRRESKRGIFFHCGENDHDVAIFQADQDAPKHGDRHIGLYHFALRLADVDELRAAYQHMKGMQANIAGFTHHGDTKSIYVKDPDGMEIEVFCQVEHDPNGTEAQVRAELGVTE